MFKKNSILFLFIMVFVFAGGRIVEGSMGGEHRAHMMGGMMGGEMSEESCQKGPGMKGPDMMGHKMGEYMMKKGMGMEMGMSQRYPWEYLKQRLDLSDEQADKLGKVYFNYRKEVLRKKADIEVGEMELRELLGASGSDKKVIEKTAGNLESFKSALNMARINALLQTKEFLSDEQYEKLAGFILGWMRPGSMRGGGCCEGMGGMMGCGQ